MTGLQLSCISFCSDGHTIAVGSEQGGKALIYDLKTPKIVKLDLKGHEKSKRVSCIQFTRLYTPSSSQNSTVAHEEKKQKALADVAVVKKSPRKIASPE